jgi:hypothetical protein
MALGDLSIKLGMSSCCVHMSPSFVRVGVEIVSLLLL